MKKIKLFVSAITLSVISQFGFAQTSQMAGTGHDFHASAWNSSGEICIVCHTPHNAVTSVTNAPLWNHSVSAVASYTLYASPTMDAAVGQPTGSSKLCLSCHDGTVALENFGGVINGTNHVSTANNVGTDLSNDHPISITYSDALAGTDGGLRLPSTATGVGTGTIAATMLTAGVMQCSSCHDVHNKYNVTHLLKKSNAGSALCLTCHIK